MERLIGRQQKAYSRERNIGSVLINLLNLMSHAKKEQTCQPHTLHRLQEGFQLNRPLLHQHHLQTVQFWGILQAVGLFVFRNNETYLLLHGHMEEKIKLEPEVPQGDFLTLYFFNFCVEILLIKISYTSTLEGLTFARSEARSETYADDTTIIIKRTEAKLRNLIKIITNFSKISGLRANFEKVHVIPIGAMTSILPEDQICRDLKLHWTKSFTLLGFEIDADLTNLQLNQSP
jgi:hypothetical protein